MYAHTTSGPRSGQSATSSFSTLDSSSISVEEIRRALVVLDVSSGTIDRDAASRLDLPAAWQEVVLLAVDGPAGIRQWIEANRLNVDLNRIGQIILWVEENPSEARDRVDAAAGGPPRFQRLSSVERKPVDWLVPMRVPLRKPTLFAGDGGLGKTTVALSYAASLSRGAPFHDSDDPVEAGSTLIISAEDDADDTLRPRLEDMGADLDRIVIPTEEQLATFTLPGLDCLDHIADQVSDLRLVIIDPPYGFMGGADDNKNSVIRSVLSQLRLFAARRQVAVILIVHCNKGSEVKTARGRILGSQAWVNGCRSVFFFGRDPGDPARSVMAHEKSNNGPLQPSLAYRLAAEDEHSPVRVEWDGEVSITADEVAAAMRPQPQGEKATEIDSAVRWMKEVLSSGPKNGDDVWQLAESTSGVKRPFKWWRDTVLKDNLGGRPRRGRGAEHSRWYWCLPGQDPPVEEASPQRADQESQESQENQEPKNPGPGESGTVACVRGSQRQESQNLPTPDSCVLGPIGTVGTVDPAHNGVPVEVPIDEEQQDVEAVLSWIGGRSLFKVADVRFVTRFRKTKASPDRRRAAVDRLVERGLLRRVDDSTVEVVSTEDQDAAVVSIPVRTQTEEDRVCEEAGNLLTAAVNRTERSNRKGGR